MNVSREKAGRGFMKSSGQSDTFSYLAETKLAGAIVWLPTSTKNQSISMVVDSNVIADLELTTLISLEEQKIADLLENRPERRQFMLRRAFQRSFVKKITGWPGTLDKLPMQHRRDARPWCSFEPDICLSFSSSGNTAMACAARDTFVGIDIERLRAVSNPVALSTRFFDPLETTYLKSLPEPQQEIEFLKFWSIKEACLKAIGKGIVFGLETFSVSVKDHIYTVQPPSDFGQTPNWTVSFVDATKDCIAVLACYAPPQI